MQWREKGIELVTSAPHRVGVCFAAVRPSKVHQDQYVAWVFRRHCKHGALGIHKTFGPDVEAIKLECERIIEKESNNIFKEVLT